MVTRGFAGARSAASALATPASNAEARIADSRICDIVIMLVCFCKDSRLASIILFRGLPKHSSTLEILIMHDWIQVLKNG